MKILHKLLTGFSLLCMMILPMDVQGQMSCGNKGIHEHMINTDPEYKERFIRLMDDIQKTKDNPEYRANARAAYVIPVVVHWVYNGETDLNQDLNYNNFERVIYWLNKSYENTEISFCLAKRDSRGNPTNGVVKWNGKNIAPSFNGLVYRNEYKSSCGGVSDKLIKEEAITFYPERDYFNIWAVQEICSDGKLTGGYGNFPWTPTNQIHGVMVDRNVFVEHETNNSKHVMAHEAGHYLGLFHTFQEACRELVTSGTCDSLGDLVCDTPPHAEETCGIVNVCNALYPYPWSNSRFNYMNYCTNVERKDRLFTPQQIDRMKYYLTANPRNTLLNSLGCTPPVQNLPDLTISNQSVSPTTVDPGANITVSFRVNNIGNAAAPANYTSIHLSSNNILTPGQNGDLYLDEYYHSQTIATGSSTGILSKSVRIPAGTAAGTYYIFISADGAETIRESNENNNQAYVQITVRGSTASCTPSVPSGLSQTSSQTSVTLGWTSVSGAQKYEVRFNNSTYSTSGTSINIPGLSCGTPYSWQVRSVCPNGNASSYSSSRTVSTSSCGSTTQNDDCGNAALIVSNGSCLTGTVRGATGSYGPNLCGGCSCQSLDDKDVYYKFVAQSTSHTVTVSDYASNFDAVIELRFACQSGTGNYIGCYDPVGVPSSVSYTMHSLVVGRTYYIRVYEYNYGLTPPSRDDFKICVTHTPQATDCDVFNYFPEVYYGKARGGSNSDESLVIHTTQYDCNYRVTKGSGCDFVSINNPTGTTDRVGSPPYIGQKEIFYTLDRNSTNSQRTCVLTVNGKRHTIIQNGCDPYFYPEAKSIKSAGETYTLEVDDESFCSWNFSQSNCSWVSFSQTSGSGSRDITVQVSPNTSSSPRTCRITLNNGETHIINQQGMVCNSPTGVNIIASSGNNTICENETVRLTAQTDCNDCTYTWSNGGKSSSVTVANQGRYTVTVANACGSKSAEITLTRASLPVQPGNINGNSIVCSGTSQSYSVAAVSGATSYEWTYTGSGYIYSMNNSITFSPESSGVLSVTANNDCGSSAERTLAITVNPLPARPEAITASTDNVCSGTAITYSIPAVSGATSYTWTYSGGGNPSGKNNSISFKPTSSGTLSVVANNACGAGTARTFAVTVNTVPDKPAISANGATDLCADQSVQLTTGQTGVSYQWRKNGSNISGATQRNYTVTTAGTYTLVTSNNCGNSSASNAITVNSLKTPARPGAITASKTNICSGETINFSVSTVSGATSYTWTYSGGGNPSGKGNSISFKPTSDGTLTVVAENACGVSTSRTLALKVSAIPTRPGAISGKSSVCSGATETYQVAAVAGAEKYTWSYSGGGNPVGTGRIITLKPSSNGTLTVIAENFCGKSTSRTFAITVNPLPARPEAINGKTAVCSGDVISYQVPVATGADSYVWTYSGGGNPSGTGRSITLKPTSSGTLTVTAKNICGNSASRTLQINVTPQPARPSLIQGSATICKGTNQTYFVDADNNVKDYTWSYTGEGTVSGTGRSITFRPNTSGTLSVTGSNTCGTSTARTMKITVKDGTPTSQPGLIKGETSYCSGETKTYSIDPVGGAKGYLWTYSGVGNPVGDGTSISLTPVSAGTLRVVALSECGGGVARTLTLSVKALPKPPVIVRNGDILTSNYNTGNQWYYNGKPLSGATEKTLTVDKKGVYSVEYTNSNGCTSISDEYQVLSTSIDEKEVGIEAFTIYPNPNDGYFTVEIISTREKDARMDIVNILGQVISSEQLNNLYGKNTIRKDLSKYGKGLYLINLYLDEGVVTRRVVIE